MRNFFCLFGLLLLLLMVLSGTAFSELVVIQSNPSVIYDDIAKQYWIRNMNRFTNMTYDEQMVGVALLNEPGSDVENGPWGNWHIASLEEMQGIVNGNGFLAMSDIFFPSVCPDVEESCETNAGYYGRYEQAIETEYGPAHYYYNIRVTPFYVKETCLLEECDILDDVSDAFIGAWVTTGLAAPQYFCSGFESPLSNGPVKVKKNRVLPVKAWLLDENGSIVEDTNLIA